METARTIQTDYPPAAFGVLARIAPNLRLAQIRSAIATWNGSRVIMQVTDFGSRVAEKRALGVLPVPAGCHALDLYDRRVQGDDVCEIVVGTESIDGNPALEQMLAGVHSLLEREHRTNLVCGASLDTHCYARVKRQGIPTPWVDLTEEFDAAEVAYVPGAKVYITRKHDGNMLGVLPIETAGKGEFAARHWKFVEVPGASEVTGIQPRIHTSRGVMVHIVTYDGNSATASYNLEMIAIGQIEAEADALARTSPWVRFRGFVDGNVAVVQSTATIEVAGVLPGINLVPTGALPKIFGPAAQRLIAACVTA